MRLQFHEKKHAYYVEKTIRLNFLPRYNIAFIAYTLYSLENRRISSVLYLSLLPSCLIQLELTFPKWFLCFGLLQHLLCFTDVELQAKDDFFWISKMAHLHYPPFFKFLPFLPKNPLKKGRNFKIGG